MRQWIKSAVGKRPGVFKNKASAVGKSTAEFAQEKKSSPGTLGKEARLAITLSKMRKK